MTTNPKSIPSLPQPRKELDAIKAYIPGKGSGTAIKLSSNENPLGISPLAAAVLRNNDELLHRYPDGTATQLRYALAKRHRCSADTIHIGNGSDEILREITYAYLERGDLVCIPRHTFSEYEAASRLTGAQITPIDMHNGAIDDAHLRSLLTKSPKIIFLCHPNNPTGASLKNLASLLQAIPSTTLVVIDQAYAEFAESGFDDAKDHINDFQNIIVLHTFSKLFGLASLRIGVAYAQAPLIAVLNKVRMPFNIGTLSQLAACAALEDELFVETTLNIVRTEKARLQQICTTLGLPYFNSDANFLCIHLGHKAHEFCEFCAKHDLYIRHLASFGMPEYIRVSIGTTDAMDVFISLLQQWNTKTS